MPLCAQCNSKLQQKNKTFRAEFFFKTQRTIERSQEKVKTTMNVSNNNILITP